MAKAWKDVIASQQYQSLPPDQQAQAQEQYFNEVVAPKAGDAADQAKQAFYSAYPASTGQQSSNLWQEPSKPTQQSESWGDNQPRSNAQDVGYAATDMGKGLLQAATGVANIPAEIADMVTGAGMSIGNDLYKLTGGTIGFPTKEFQTAPRIPTPDSLKPQTIGGQITGEALPYLIPTGMGTASVKGAGLAEKIGTKAAQMIGENVPGALAQSSGEGEQGDLAKNLAVGAVGSSIAHPVTAAIGKAAGPIVKSAREWLSPTQKVMSDADASARAGINATSDAAQNQSAQSIGEAVTKGDYASLASEIKPQDSILKAAKELDMEEALLPSHYSQSQTYRAVEQGLKSVPASQMRAKEYETINQLAQKADDLIGLAGGTTNKVGLSEKFKSESQKAIDQLARKSNAVYDEVGANLPKRTPVDSSATVNFLKEKAEDLGGIENLSAPERLVLSRFGGSTQPTYGLVDNTRKQIGAAINKNQGPFKDQTSAELKQLYSAITDDQEKVAQQFGMGEKWGIAKGLVSQRKQLEDHMVTALGKDLSGTFSNKMTPAIRGLRTGNVQAFDRLIAATPPHMRQEVVASALNDALTLGSRKEKQLSIPGFVDWYEGARRSGALNRVMKHLPIESRRNMSNLYKVSSGIRRANEEAIGTGRLDTLIKALDSRNGVLEHLHGAAEKGAAVAGASVGAMVGGGPVGAAIGGAIGGGLGHAASKSLRRPARSIAADALFADPMFQSALIRATKNNQAAVSRAVENLPAWKRFAGHLSADEVRNIGRAGAIGWLNGDSDTEM